MLANDIAKLMAQIPLEDTASAQQGTTTVKGGVFAGHQDTSTPFGFKRYEGAEAGRGETDWVVEKDKPKYDEIFDALRGSDGKVAGAAAKAEMVKSKLPNTVLAKVRVLVVHLCGSFTIFIFYFFMLIDMETSRC